MDPLPLGHAVGGRDHLPVERGVDRLAPAMGLAGRDAEQERPHAPAGWYVAPGRGSNRMRSKA